MQAMSFNDFVRGMMNASESAPDMEQTETEGEERPIHEMIGDLTKELQALNFTFNLTTLTPIQKRDDLADNVAHDLKEIASDLGHGALHVNSCPLEVAKWRAELLKYFADKEELGFVANILINVVQNHENGRVRELLIPALRQATRELDFWAQGLE